MLPMTVYADEVNGADTAWVLTSTALVLFMTLPGLALFYSRSGSGKECSIRIDAVFCYCLPRYLLYGWSLPMVWHLAMVGL